MQDSQSLINCKIDDGDVVQLVAKTTTEPVQEEPVQQENREPIFNLLNRIVGTEPREGRDGLSIPPLNRRSARRVREDTTNFNANECKETINQNIATLNSLIKCDNNYSESDNIELFDFKKRNFVKGQWVDVKDTIDQWLEAQVIDVREHQVQIHYNGWGTRWDEWIDTTSNRIRPFRYHTKQTSFSNYNSAFPNNKPDANISINSNKNMFDMFDDVKKSFDHAGDIIKSIHNNKTGNFDKHTSQKKIYYEAKRIAPIYDKLGRIMTDMGTFIHHTLKNNELDR
jgi:hypothetical protein